MAAELISELREIKGVSGIHLMLLGPDHTILPQLVENLPRSSSTGN
jgi:hypothetical protein